LRHLAAVEKKRKKKKKRKERKEEKKNKECENIFSWSEASRWRS